MAADWAPWTSRPGIQLHGVPMHRERLGDLLDVGFGIKIQEARGQRTTTAALIDGYFCDLSVGVGWCPFKTGSPHTFRQNSYCYSYAHDMVVSGSGQLMLMGWPRSHLPAAEPDSDFRSLSGESYSLPLCAVLNFLAFANPYGPWWAPSD